MGNEQVRLVENHRYPSGNTYTGQLKGGKRHGQGTLIWRDGAVYKGSWVNDQCQGYGQMTFPNGSIFDGNWVRSNPHGQGKLTTINGEVLNGYWEFHGRSDRTSTPVGKYQFRGELLDLKNNERRNYIGPIALYLLSGLVSLPNMPDPMESILPYAIAMVDDNQPSDTVLAEQGRLLFKDSVGATDSIPMAEAIQNAPTSTSSISYGRQEAAFQQRHRDDHPTYNLLDPRLYLAGLGVPTQPTNTNRRRQEAIRQQQHMELNQNSTSVPIAVPVNNPSNQPGQSTVFY